MIRLSDIDGLDVFIVPTEIASIAQTNHTNAIVFMRDGRRHEVRETASHIAELLTKAETT